MNSVTRLKALSLHQEIIFGLDGNDSPFLGEGWADAEIGCRRMLGNAGDIRLIHPGNTDLLLELAGMTTVSAVQRIDVEMNGRLAATIDLPNGLPRAAYIPAGHVPPGQILTLRLRLPVDGRVGTSPAALSRLRLFALRSQAASGAQPGEVSGVPPRTILGFFEGLGDTREFGVVQQSAGVRKSGLLPYTFTSLPSLLRALDAGFAGLGDAETFDVLLYPHAALDYVVVDKTYGVEFRGAHEADEIRLSTFIDQQGARLRDVRRDLMRTIGAGEKIFVVYRGGPGPALTEQEVLPLLIALNRHGPNHLLWVLPADAANPPGTVRQNIPFLLQGAIDRFQAGPDIRTAPLDTWLTLCRKALEIAFPSGSPGAAHIKVLDQRGSQQARPAWPAGKQDDPPEDQPRHEAAGAFVPGTMTGAPPTRPPPEPSQAAASPQAPKAANRAAPASAVIPAGMATATAGRTGDYALLQSWRFGESGNEEAVLGFGWSGPEDGFRWTEGTACELWLDHPGKRDVFVVVEAWPFVTPPDMPVQRAEFSAHDAALGTLAFTETSRLALPVAASALRPGRVMRLRCELPDAARPSERGLSTEDARQLGIGFILVSVHAAPPREPRRQAGIGGISIEEAQQRTGLSAADFLARFEPLGETQTLSALQAELGQEAQGLFHRASLRLLDLVRVLDTRLEGVGDPSKLQAELIGGDPELYEIRDGATGLSYVIERAKSDASPEMLAARQARRLKFLRDQLLHDLSAGQKIFVFHRSLEDAALTEPEMLALLLSLRQLGPATLLFLTLADETNPPGTVVQLYPGLLQGYLNAEEAEDGNEAAWLEVLANALVLSAQ